MATVRCDVPNCNREAIKKGTFSNICRKHLRFYTRHNPGVKMETLERRY